MEEYKEILQHVLHSLKSDTFVPHFSLHVKALEHYKPPPLMSFRYMFLEAMVKQMFQ